LRKPEILRSRYHLRPRYASHAGRSAEEAPDRKGGRGGFGRAHITCNKNGIPFDPEKPTVTSGVRLGTPAGTTRGFGIAEFRQVGDLIAEVLDALARSGTEQDAQAEASVREKVKRLVGRFPIYEG
jgi:glycine hydroxymethyltransferase